MADILGTDEFLVNRDDVTYTQEQATLMANLETDDLLLVNRADATYTVTGGELIESVIDPLSLTVTITPTSAYIGDDHTATPVVSGGKIPTGGYVFTYQWVIADDDSGTNQSSIAGANTSNYTPVSSQEGKYLGCTCTTTDFFGTSATATGYIGPISVLAQAPEIDSIILTEIEDGENRYTSKDFPFTTSMNIAGEPNPTYKAKVKLSGSTFDFDVLSDSITKVEGGGTDICETDTIEKVAVEETPTYSYSGSVTYADGAIQYPGEPPSNAFNGAGSQWTIQTPSETKDFSASFELGGTVNSPLVSVYGSNLKLSLVAGGERLPAVWANDDPTGEIFYFSENTETLDCQFTVAVTKINIGAYDLDSNCIANDYFTVFNFSVNGEELVDDTTTINAGTTLTFPSNTGFSCFDVGDVVQGDNEYPGGVKLRTDQTNPTNAFNVTDGDLNSFCLNDQQFLYFDIPTDNTTINVVLENTSGSSRPFYIQNGSGYQNSQGNWDADTNGFTTGGSGHTNQIEIPANSGKVTLTYTNTAATKGTARLYYNTADSAVKTYSITANGTAGIESATLISKTSSAPWEMEVSGGKWNGANQSQVWSDDNSGNWNTSGPVQNMFDGRLSSQSFGGGDNTSTVTITGLTANDKIRVYFYTGDTATAGGTTDQWEINNVNISALHPNPGVGSTIQWVDVTSAFSLPVAISEVKAANNNQGGMNAIEIDGKILVDTSFNEYNWSDGSALPTPENVFDGDYLTTASTPYGTKTIYTSDPFTAQTIETYQNGLTYPNSSFSFYVNGVEYSGTQLTATQVSGATGWLKVDLGAPTVVNSFASEWTSRGTDTDQYTVNTVKADDKFLVDQRVLGSTKISKETTYSNKLTVASDLNFAALTGDIIMSNGGGNTATDPYKLVTTDIQTVAGATYPGTWTIVAGEASSSPTSPLSPSTDNVFNGDPASFAYFDYQKTSNLTSRYKYTFATPIPFEKLEAYVGAYDGSASAIVSFNGGTGIRGGSAGALVKEDFTTNANAAPGATEGLLESFEIGCNAANYGYIAQIEVDGAPLAITNKVLTFTGAVTTNPDLQYFKETDVVQTAPLEVFNYQTANITIDGDEKIFPVPSNPTQAVDGDSNTRAQTVSDNGGYVKNGIDVVFRDGFGGTNGEASVKIASASALKMAVNGDFDNAFQPVLGTGDWVDLTDKKTGKLTRLTFWAEGNYMCAIYGFGASRDGTNLLDTSGTYGTIDPSNDIKVVTNGYDLDPKENKLVVSGGTWNNGDQVEYQTYGGKGKIVSTDAATRTILLSNPGTRDNRWIIGTTDEDGNPGNTGETGNAANAQDFYVKPEASTPIQQATAWGITRVASNKLEVTGIQKDEPSWTDATDIGSKDYTVTFPATFATGNAPDTDLPDGTAISVWLEAKNSEGSDTKESNVLTPADVNPSNAAGPITDSTETTIEVDSSANLDTFTLGADLVMIDSTGSVANYTPQTSSIISVPTPGPVDPVLNYRDVGEDFPQTGVNDQTSNTNFDKTWTVGERKTDGYVIIDKGAGYEYAELTFTPDGSGAQASGSNDMLNWTTIDGIPGGRFVGYRYIWPQSTMAAYGGGVTYTSMTEGGLNLSFESPNPDLKFFRSGDVVQLDDNYLSDDYVSMGVINGTAYGDWNNVFNGTIDTSSSTSAYVSPVSNGETCVFTPSTPIPIKNDLTLYAYVETLAAGLGPAIVLNDNVQARVTGTYGAAETYTAAELGYELKKITVKRQSTGGYLAAIKVDGRLLIDPSVATSITVNDIKCISVDTTNNKMIVSGGDWDSSNQSEVWSDGTSVGDYQGNRTIDKAFDGDSSTFAQRDNAAGTTVYTFATPVPVTGAVTFKAMAENANTQVYLTGPNGDSSAVSNTGTDGVAVSGDVSSEIGNAINSITFVTDGTGTSRLYEIRVDDKLLVDAANDSQVWSNSVGGVTGGSAYNLFDGTLPALGTIPTLSDNAFGTLAYFQPTAFSDPNSVTSLTIYYSKNTGSSDTLTVDGSSITLVADDTVHTVDVAVTSFSNITWTHNGVEGVTLMGFVVNGKILVDTGVRDLGDTKVTIQTPVTGTAKFASTNNTDTLTVTDSNDRWIDNTNRLGTAFYVKDKLKRGLNADSATDRAKFQAIEDAFDSFAANVASRSAQLASIFARLVEGQSVSEAEVSVLTTAIQDEINIQEPFALDGYYPLYITASKAEAASSLNSYHTHTIEGDTYYMPDGGTIYHGTYVG